MDGRFVGEGETSKGTCVGSSFCVGSTKRLTTGDWVAELLSWEHTEGSSQGRRESVAGERLLVFGHIVVTTPAVVVRVRQIVGLVVPVVTESPPSLVEHTPIGHVRPWTPTEGIECRDTEETGITTGIGVAPLLRPGMKRRDTTTTLGESTGHGADGVLHGAVQGRPAGVHLVQYGRVVGWVVAENPRRVGDTQG